MLPALAGVLLGSAMLVGASNTASASPAWPGIGLNTLGPQIIITLNADGSVNIGAGPSVGPYDGSDDAYIGVINNSSAAVNVLTISSSVSSNGGIFGFEGDGIGNGYLRSWKPE